MGIEPIIHNRPTNPLAPCMPMNDEVYANLFGFPKVGFLTLPIPFIYRAGMDAVESLSILTLSLLAYNKVLSSFMSRASLDISPRQDSNPRSADLESAVLNRSTTGREWD